MIVIAIIFFLIAAGLGSWALFGKHPWASDRSFLAGCAAVVLAVVGLCLFGVGVIRASAKHVIFTVRDKAVAGTNDGHEYQIFSTDGQVFADKDSVSFWKFNSSNVYGQLQIGHTYDCLVTGWRIPILSVKNNIISCTETTAPAGPTVTP